MRDPVKHEEVRRRKAEARKAARLLRVLNGRAVPCPCRCHEREGAGTHPHQRCICKAAKC